jgi:hypothetical protein
MACLALSLMSQSHNCLSRMGDCPARRSGGFDLAQPTRCGIARTPRDYMPEQAGQRLARVPRLRIVSRSVSGQTGGGSAGAVDAVEQPFTDVLAVAPVLQQRMRTREVIVVSMRPLWRVLPVLRGPSRNCLCSSLNHRDGRWTF